MAADVVSSPSAGVPGLSDSDAASTGDLPGPHARSITPGGRPDDEAISPYLPVRVLVPLSFQQDIESYQDKPISTIMITPTATSAQDPDSPAAPFRWSQVSGQPDTWARRLWGSELFYHQWATVADHASDTVHFFVMSSTSELFQPETFTANARKAWLRCRFLMPIIAGRVEKGVVPGCPAHLGCMVYTSVSDSKVLDQWLDKVVVVHRLPPGPSDPHNFEIALDQVRAKLSSESVTDDAPTILHLVQAHSPDEKGAWRHAIVLQAPHFLADGAAGVAVFRAVMDGIAGEAVRSTTFAWGEEIANLPPCLPDAMELDPMTEDMGAALKMMGPFEPGKKRLCLPAQRTEIKGPVGLAEKQEFTMDEESTKNLIKRLKKKGGFTVSHAVDAARHAAIWWIRNKMRKEENIPIDETDITTLLLPLDCTRYFKGAWKGKPYFASGTTGFTTSVPLEALPPLVDIEHFDNAEASQAYLLQCFECLLPMLAGQWRDIDPYASVGGLNVVLKLLRADIENPIHLKSTEPSDGYTTLGVLERIIPRQLPLISGAPLANTTVPHLTVESYGGSPRLATPHMIIHTFMFWDKIVVHASYSQHYDDAFVAEFLRLIQVILQKVAEQEPQELTSRL